MQPPQALVLFSLGAYPLSYLFHTPLTNLRQLRSIPVTNRIAQLHKEHTAGLEACNSASHTIVWQCQVTTTYWNKAMAASLPGALSLENKCETAVWKADPERWQLESKDSAIITAMSLAVRRPSKTRFKWFQILWRRTKVLWLPFEPGITANLNPAPHEV